MTHHLAVRGGLVTLLAVSLVTALLNLLGTTQVTLVLVQSSSFSSSFDFPNKIGSISMLVTPELHSDNFRMDPMGLRRQTAGRDIWSLLEDHSPLTTTSNNMRESSDRPNNNATSSSSFHYYHAHRPTTASHICRKAPGQDLEQPEGWQLLQKIQVASAMTASQPLRLFCGIYTHTRMHALARAAALTWGRQCDGFVAFSNHTVLALNLLDLRHAGPEEYGNMWQKTRSIWTYIHRHYANDYDIFHLGGDDMYVLPENLKLLYADRLASLSPTWSEPLASSNATQRPPPVFMGQWVPHGPHGMFVGGGGGYTLNQPALQALVEQALPQCHERTVASFEDRLITKCLGQIDIHPTDTRDRETAEQTYHDVDPAMLYMTVAVPPDSPHRRRASFHAKAAAYWQDLRHPSHPDKTVGVQTGLAAAAKYSVSFHKIVYPDYMVRLHMLLRPQPCPAASGVGQHFASLH